ncbi:hypothetical protein D3C79_650580 [compost metagenome]
MHTIEQLEPSSYHQQANGQLDDVSEGRITVVEEQPDQRVGHQPEQHGKAQHHRCAKANTNPSGMACAKQVTSTIVEPDTHGDGIGQPGRNHERSRNDLQGDLVRRQFSTAQHTHAQCGKSEQTDFYRIGTANRQTQTPQLTQGRPRRAAQALTNRVGRVSRVPANVQGHGHRHAVGHDGGHQADTDQPQLG